MPPYLCPFLRLICNIKTSTYLFSLSPPPEPTHSYFCLPHPISHLTLAVSSPFRYSIYRLKGQLDENRDLSLFQLTLSSHISIIISKPNISITVSFPKSPLTSHLYLDPCLTSWIIILSHTTWNQASSPGPHLHYLSTSNKILSSSTIPPHNP